MNFTDLDDNTINGATKSGKSLKEFTDHYIREFMQDIEVLGVKKATGYPRASEHVDDRITSYNVCYTKLLRSEFKSNR